MGVFNFVDDGSIPGCAVLKLSDGRKRSMSLWVEFITASGYLSARKIRSRFQALVVNAVEKSNLQNKCKLLTTTSDVQLLVYEKYTVKITCAFRCNSIWPRSAGQWPALLNNSSDVNTNSTWPSIELIKEVRCEGFDLLSRESFAAANSHHQQQILLQQNHQQHLSGTGSPLIQHGNSTCNTGNNNSNNTMEGDAWAMSMTQAESLLLAQPNRKKALAILKTLRDRHLDYTDSPITNYIIKTLTLFECEKHSSEYEWHDFCIGERVIGNLYI